MPEGLCTLQYAAGRLEDCPGARCPFWEERGEPGCVVAPIERVLIEQPHLSQHLLGLRLEFDRACVSAAEPPPRSLFYRLLNEAHTAE